MNMTEIMAAIAEIIAAPIKDIWNPLFMASKAFIPIFINDSEWAVDTATIIASPNAEPT